MDVSETLNRAIAHINSARKGDVSEPHISHAIWNLFAVLHYVNMCNCHQHRGYLKSVTEGYENLQKSLI